MLVPGLIIAEIVAGGFVVAASLAVYSQLARLHQEYEMTDQYKTYSFRLLIAMVLVLSFYLLVQGIQMSTMYGGTTVLLCNMTQSAIAKDVVPKAAYNALIWSMIAVLFAMIFAFAAIYFFTMHRKATYITRRRWEDDEEHNYQLELPHVSEEQVKAFDIYKQQLENNIKTA